MNAPHLDLGRLPIPGPHFVGRKAEIARLDAAWEDPAIHVLTLVAFGGVGKSALVARWLDRMSADSWREAARVLDWSFYSQGMENRVTSAEPFIDHALGFFGDPDPKAGSLHDRGARLAHLIRKERSLLVLLGNFLRRAHGGDVRKRREIDLHRADDKQGGHASRVIDAYARWLGGGIWRGRGCW